MGADSTRAGLVAAAGLGPARSCVDCSLMTTEPFSRGTKRTIRLTFSCGPPAASQGTHTL